MYVCVILKSPITNTTVNKEPNIISKLIEINLIYFFIILLFFEKITFSLSAPTLLSFNYSTMKCNVINTITALNINVYNLNMGHEQGMQSNHFLLIDSNL